MTKRLDLLTSLRREMLGHHGIDRGRREDGPNPHEGPLLDINGPKLGDSLIATASTTPWNYVLERGPELSGIPRYSLRFNLQFVLAFD